MDIIGPQLGYFVFSTPEGGDEQETNLSSLSLQEMADFRTAQFENEERQFVSGFDPDFIPMQIAN